MTDVRTPSVSAANNTGSINAGQSYSVNFAVTCSSGNNQVGSTNPTYWDTTATGYAPNPTWFYRSDRTYSGYCQGYWTGAGAKISAPVSTSQEGYVWVRNPNPPVPAAPSSCSYNLVSASQRTAIDQLAWSCSGVAYATSYTASESVLYANTLSGDGGTQTMSTPSFSFGCMTYDATSQNGWTSVTIKISANNISGSSTIYSQTITTPTSVRVGPACS